MKGIPQPSEPTFIWPRVLPSPSPSAKGITKGITWRLVPPGSSWF